MKRPDYILFYLVYRATSAGWYWMSRRFTPVGLFVVAALFVVATTGVDIENTVTYQAFTLLLALVILGVGASWFFRGRFSGTRRMPRVGTVGQPLPYRVSIKNLTSQRQDGLTLLENVADPRPGFQDWLAFQLAENRRVRPFHMSQRRRRNPFRIATIRAVELPSLPAFGEVEVAVEVMPLRRGVLALSGMTIARADPMGIYRSFLQIPAVQTVLILPKRYALPAVALPGAMRYQQGGVALAANVGRSEEFVALREYRHGDPLRHIHWRSWAKTGKPIVKEFEDEFFVRHALVLDTFDDEPYSEILEEAVSVAASFACTVLTQESLLDLLFVGNQSYCFTAGRGLAHAGQMLEILASVRNCPDQPFSNLEELVINHVSIVSGCICILQKWNEARRSLINKLKALGVPMLVFVIAPAGEVVRNEDGSPLETSDSLQILELGKIQEALTRLK